MAAALRGALLLACLTLGARAMFISNGTIYNDAGEPINWHGLHIFGLNTQTTAAGLSWETKGRISEVADFRTVLWRIKQLGFNAVRLPFNFYFRDQPTMDYTEPCEVSSVEALVAGLTPPGVTVDAGLIEMPPDVPGGVCNAGMPSDYIERVVWTVCAITEAGLYVAPDFHLDYSLKSETTAPIYDRENFAEQWADLVRRIVAAGCDRDRLIIDFINEADAYGIAWDGTKNAQVVDRAGLAEYYRVLYDKVFPECPKCLYFVGGTDQWAWPTLSNWGDGFATKLQLFEYNEAHCANKTAQGEDCHVISSAAGFFNWLVQQPEYLAQTVVAPHVYCPQVANNTGFHAGPKQWLRLTNTFGYLTNEGFVDADGAAWTFPVVIGETGTSFRDELEKECFASTADYINNAGNATSADFWPLQSWQEVAYANSPDAIYSGEHATIGSWFWWVWNPDSEDTGGLVAEDRQTIEWFRVLALSGDSADFPEGQSFGLEPWYKQAPVTVVG